MAARDKGWFLEHIYNDEYVKVDPEYVKDRPERQSKNLIYRYSYARKAIRHLDYGAGNGELVRRMAAAGFDSTPYDPFSHASRPEGVFNLISCFEVFEHVPDPQALMADLASLLSPQGVLLFSTLTSDGAISQGKPLDWWYAAPRNGHISLFSRESLARLAKQHGLHYQITQQGTHAFWKELPPWAAD